MTLLSTKDAAKILGVSPGRVRQFVAWGELSAKKYGNSNLIEKKDLETFMKRRANKGNTDPKTMGS